MNKVKKIADMAIFISIAMLLNIVSFPLFGYFGRISFVYSLCYLVGIFYGPIVGFCIASIGDLLPALLLPQGPWMPVITLSVGMIAAIVGVANKYLKCSFGLRLAIGAFFAYLICTLVLTPIGELPLFNMYPYTFAKLMGRTFNISSPFLMLSLAKGISQSVWILLNVGLSYFVCIRLKNVISNRFGDEILKLNEKTIKL